MARSIPHLFFHVVARHGSRPAFRESSAGRTWTYDELGAAVREAALGFTTLGVGHGDRVGLFADSSVEWILTDLALLTAGAADVPRGLDTSAEELDLIIRHSGARVVVLESRAQLDRLLPVLSDIAELQCIVLLHGEFREGDPRPVLSLAEVRERGRRLLAQGRCVENLCERLSENDVATIVYTSGTTGNPKGVTLTHRNILHNVRAIPAVVDFESEDVFLSILPAWHMFERLIEYGAISKGCLTVFSSKRTLRSDFLRVRPTVFAAVPRVWESLHDEGLKALRGLRPPLRLLLWAALRGSVWSRRARLVDRRTGRRGHPLWRVFDPCHHVAERLVYRKLRGVLGGRLRTLVSGGGTLPLHVDAFFEAAGLPILNGYGLTETAPLVSVRRRHRIVLGTVGPPIPGTEVEVRDESGRVLPVSRSGTIHVRGPQVMVGYWRDLEATRRAIGPDGFLDTGDLGRLLPTGDLEITGRAKDTIVLLSGENVEPEPIETALRASPLIEQVLVVGQDRKHLGALVVPNWEEVEARLGVPAAPGPRSVAARPDPREVEELLRREIDRIVHPARGFRPCERIVRFALLERPFSQESGELTATLKPRRHVICERYRDLIERLFNP